MATFVDTSGILTLLNPAEQAHESAWATWDALTDQGEALTTSRFVPVESHALLQARIGVEAVLCADRVLHPGIARSLPSVRR